MLRCDKHKLGGNEKNPLETQLACTDQGPILLLLYSIIVLINVPFTNVHMVVVVISLPSYSASTFC